MQSAAVKQSPPVNLPGITTGGSLGGLLVGAVLGIIFTTLVCSVRHRKKIAPQQKVAGRAQRSQPDEEAEKQAHTAPVEQPVRVSEEWPCGVRMTEEQRAPEEQPEIASGEQHVGSKSEPPNTRGERGQWLDTIAYSVRNPADTPPDTPSTTNSPPTTPSSLPTTPSRTHSPPTTPSSLPTTPSRTHSPPTTPSRTCLSQS